MPSQNIFARRLKAGAKTIVSALQKARKEIIIVSPNLNEMTYWRAIVAAARRGVRCKIVIGYRHNHTNVWAKKFLLGYRTNLDLVSKMQKHQNLDVRYVRRPDRPVPVADRADHTVHAKVMIVDNEFVYMGSANFDIFSTYTSGEAFIFLKSKLAAATLKENFVTPCLESSTSSTLSEKK